MKIGASLDPPPVSIAEFEHLNSEVHEPDPRPHGAHTDPADTCPVQRQAQLFRVNSKDAVGGEGVHAVWPCSIGAEH